VTQDDKLINGENFSTIPGKMGIFHYKVKINIPAAITFGYGPIHHGQKTMDYMLGSTIHGQNMGRYAMVRR
jgi:hypothetical protein